MRQLPEGAPILCSAAMQRAEERAFAAGVYPATLMERAGIAVAQAARRFAGLPPVVVLAGPGNNGGDGFVAARHLAAWGHDVTVHMLGEPRHGIAAEMAARWSGVTRRFDGSGAPSSPYLLIDGLFGIGLSRPLSLDPAQRALIDDARFRLAIDVPSGIDANSGADLGGIGAMTATVALGALKPVHALVPQRCGTVLVDGLDLSITSDWETLCRPGELTPTRDQHKYRALVTIVSGAMPGAARLAARGAAGAGAGYVELAGAADTGPLDAVVHRPTADFGETRGILVIGPGLGRDVAARSTLEAALAAPRTLVLDGDALTLLGGSAARLARSSPTILTPHEGEFDRMFGHGGGDKIARTLAAAASSGATIVHKGATTVIATPAGGVRVSTAGSPWLATAGTGDVLAGAIAATGSAEAGVWLHARAASLAGPAFSADRLADLLPAAVCECR